MMGREVADMANKQTKRTTKKSPKASSKKQ